MNFWGVAVGIAGLGAIASFVIWSLYKQWLTLPIFQRMTKKQQFVLFLVFLSFTFLFALAALGAYVYVASHPTGGEDAPEPPETLVNDIAFSRFVEALDKAINDGPESLDAFASDYENNEVTWKCMLVEEPVVTSKAYWLGATETPAFHGRAYAAFAEDGDYKRLAKKGDQVKLKGVIERVDQAGASLRDCHLLSWEPGG